MKIPRNEKGEYDLPVNTKFQLRLGYVTLRVEKARSGCTGCYFYTTDQYGWHPCNYNKSEGYKKITPLACDGYARADKQNVIFKRVRYENM